MSKDVGSEDKEYYYSLADMYLESGQTGRAVFQATRNIAYNEDDPTAYINRARIYEKLGSLENAICDLQEAIRVSPDNKDAAECLERIQKKIHRISTDQSSPYCPDKTHL